MTKLQEAIMQADQTQKGWQAKIAKELGVSRNAVSLANKALQARLQKQAALAALTVDGCGTQKRIDALREDFKTLVKSCPYSYAFIEKACGFSRGRLNSAIAKGHLGIYMIMKTLAFFGKKLAIVDLDEKELAEEKGE